MANITLPSNPVNGQTVVIGTRLFQYDSTANRWKSRVFQVLGDTSVTVPNESPTITASLSEIALDTSGANVSFTYTVSDVDSSVLKVSHSVSGIANSDLATVTHHRANNTVTITAGTEAFTGGQITLTVTDGRNNATDTVDVSAAYGYNISNATHIGSISLTSQISTPYGLTAKSDGTKMYVGDIASDKVYQYSLSTPFDVSTATYDNKSYAYGTHDITGWTLKPDGTRMWGSLSYSASLTQRIIQYDLSTPYDVSTMSENGFYEISRPAGIAFKNDGTKCYIMRRSNYTIYEYSLSTAWDITSIGASTGSFYVATFDNSPYEIDLSTDGTKIFMTGDQFDRVYQIDMSTAFDITTASYNNINFHTAEAGAPYLQGNPNSLYISPDGMHMIIGGQTNDRVSSFNIG
jgi:hypothetical protein